MGGTNSRSLGESGPEAALLIAVRKGEHQKALRLLETLPSGTQTISHTAKAVAVHSAVKRGYVSILQFLRDLPNSSSSTGVEATPEAAGPGRSVGLAGRGQPSSSHRSSRLSHSNDSHNIGHGAESGGRQFVERDSWLNAVNRHGCTPLFTAVRYNRLEFVEGLVSLGADPWAADRTSRGTALHTAALLGHAPLVAALLKSPVVGPNPRVALCDAQDMYGFTPLHYAAAAGHADVARVLLDAGASYTAASQLLYDPSPLGLRRLTSLSNMASRAGIGLVEGLGLGGRGGGGGGGGGGDGENRSGGLCVPCAPRSNPLHLAALRGDGVMATLLLQRFLADTDGLSRAARDRVTDPRTQLNKDGFQPYMLAGNAGYWHVAQLLIPHSRDDRHHLSRNRDRDFLIFFPLPETGGGAAAGGSGRGGEGPPLLCELAARAWAAKLLADVKSAEGVVRQSQQQHSQSFNHLTASPVSVGGGGGGVGGGSPAAALFRDPVRGASGAGGVLGALLRRSGRGAGVSSSGTGATAAAAAASTTAAAAAAVLGSNAPGGGLDAFHSLPVAATSAAMPATAAAATSYVASAVGSGLMAGASPGVSAVSTPRTSASGAFGGYGGGCGGAARGASPPRRSQMLLATSSRDSRRATSLDLTPRSPRPAPPSAAATAAAAAPSPSTSILPPSPFQLAPAAAAVVVGAPGSPVAPSLALCDVCFEQPQELLLRPCPHRMCASCCRRVVEMHCAGAGPGGGGAAAGAGGGAGRPGRPVAVPPRCPFCQATIRGFAPAAAGAAARQ